MSRSRIMITMIIITIYLFALIYDIPGHENFKSKSDNEEESALSAKTD